MMQKRRTALAVAALLASAISAHAAGAFVTKTVQDGAGIRAAQFFDMSGAGTGPFIPVTMSVDSSGNPSTIGCTSGAPCFFTPSAVLPIFESRERLARAGAYYTFSTGNGGDFTKGGLAVAAGSYLNVRTCNVGTKTAYRTKVIYDMSATSPLAYGGVASPAPLTGAQVSGTAAVTTTGSNITVGQGASSTVQMTYSVGTTPLNNAAGNAVPTGTGYLYPNNKNELTELRILPPGQCFGQYVSVPSGLGGTQYVGIRMYEYEE